MVIAYFLVCTCVWAVLQSLSEMTIAFPTSGNYIDYADRWVDPALAFGAGFAEWLGKKPLATIHGLQLTLAQVGPLLSPPKPHSSIFSSSSGRTETSPRLPPVSAQIPASNSEYLAVLLQPLFFILHSVKKH